MLHITNSVPQSRTEMRFRNPEFQRHLNLTTKPQKDPKRPRVPRLWVRMCRLSRPLQSQGGYVHTPKGGSRDLSLLAYFTPALALDECTYGCAGGLGPDSQRSWPRFEPTSRAPAEFQSQLQFQSGSDFQKCPGPQEGNTVKAATMRSEGHGWHCGSLCTGLVFSCVVCTIKPETVCLSEVTKENAKRWGMGEAFQNAEPSTWHGFSTTQWSMCKLPMTWEMLQALFGENRK